jgi:hypothetical protein
MGSHLFDLLIYFFGMPRWVEGYETDDIPSYDSRDPNIKGALMFPKGVKVYLHPSAYGWLLDIVGEESTQRVVPRPPKSEIYMVAATNYILDYLDGNANLISCGREAALALEVIVAMLLSAKNDGHRVYLPLVDPYGIEVYAR